jgi:predicted RNA-binding protein
MAYYINLLTPETYEAFSLTARNVVGFRERQRASAEEIQPGDMLICYVLKTAKLVGVL